DHGGGGGEIGVVDPVVGHGPFRWVRTRVPSGSAHVQRVELAVRVDTRRRGDRLAGVARRAADVVEVAPVAGGSDDADAEIRRVIGRHSVAVLGRTVVGAE